MAMGDIAFNLLVFFLILARAQDDSHLKWNAASTPKVENTGYARVSIVVDINNKLYLDGKEIGVAQLSGGITKVLGDTPPGQRTVLLKIHNSTLAQRFQPIIEAVSEAGGDLVHVLEEKKK
jgi:biopolymer transport protein ExbD